MSLQEARDLLHMYLSSSSNTKFLKESLWVVCNGEDLQRTIFLGSQIDQGWVMRGSICIKDDTTVEKIQKQGDKLKKAHIMRSVIPEEKMISEVMCVYDIFGTPRGSGTSRVTTNNEPYESVSLEIVWKNSILRRNLITPPPEADTTLVVEAPVGKEQSVLYPLWLQLLYLEQLMTNLASNEAKLPQSPFSQPRNVDRVQEFIDSNIDYRHRWGVQEPSYQTSSDDLIVTVTKVAQSGYAHHDFTHKLWPLIICSENVKDMIQSLECVFEAVKNGDIKPYIHRQNKTFIGQTIEDLRNGSDSWQDLAMLNPLEMLLEIGMDALKRDYTFLFKNLDLCTMDQLRNNAQVFNTRENLAWYGQMHCTLEMLLVTQCHLNLAPRSIYPIVISAIDIFRKELPTFEELLQNRQIVFCHPVKTTDIQDNITKDFCSWRLRLTSESSLQKTTTVCYCSTRSIFPPLLFKPEFEGDIESSPAYYCSVLTISGDKMD